MRYDGVRPTWLVISLVLLVGCSSRPTGSGAVVTARHTSPSVNNCPGVTSAVLGSAIATPLFAFLETRRAGVKESEYAASHDTLTLVGPDGYARVRLSFPPRQEPDISAAGGAVPVLQPEAVVAADALYLVD